MKIKLINYIDILYKKTHNEINKIKASFDKIKEAQDGLLLKDRATGFDYEIFIDNGELKVRMIPAEIEIVTLPNKLNYDEMEYVDLSGLTLKVSYPDGSNEIINDVSEIECNQEQIFEDNILIVSYLGFEFMIEITINPFDPVATLIDFDYTDNGDGTYTIISWKGTYQGQESTEIIIPNSRRIIL